MQSFVLKVVFSVGFSNGLLVALKLCDLFGSLFSTFSSQPRSPDEALGSRRFLLVASYASFFLLHFEKQYRVAPWRDKLSLGQVLDIKLVACHFVLQGI